jgi:3-hydroxyisobutyrate dehydrogenase
MLKDLTLVTDAAKSAKQPVMLGALAQQIYQKHSPTATAPRISPA